MKPFLFDGEFFEGGFETFRINLSNLLIIKWIKTVSYG